MDEGKGPGLRQGHYNRWKLGRTEQSGKDGGRREPMEGSDQSHMTRVSRKKKGQMLLRGG